MAALFTRLENARAQLPVLSLAAKMAAVAKEPVIMRPHNNDYDESASKTNARKAGCSFCPSIP